MNRSKGYRRAVMGSFEERHPRMKEEILEPLVTRTLAGDARASQELWLVLDPVIEEIAASGKVTGRLGRRRDERRDVVLLVMEKLVEDGARRLVELQRCLRRGDGSFRRWFWTVVRNLAVNFTVAHPDHVGAVKGAPWARNVEVRDDLAGDGPDVLSGILAGEILAFAERELRPVQLAALLMWMDDRDAEEIAVALGLEGAAAASRVVRSAIERLRYHFAEGQGGEGEPGKNKSSGVPDEVAKKTDL